MKISRRKFISLCGYWGVGLYASRLLAEENKEDFERVFAVMDSPKNPPIPDDRRSSGGLDYFRLDDDEDGVLLKFPKFVAKFENFRNPKIKLALGNALENRDSVVLFVRSAKNGRIFAREEVVNMFGFEPIRIDLDKADAKEIEAYGLVVTCSRFKHKCAENIKKQPVCFFADNVQKDFDALAPQILIYEEKFNRVDSYYKNFYSLNSILPFGWMSGCQTEGLRELAETGDNEALQTLKKHLNFFLDDKKGVVFNDPTALLCENGKFHSIEDFLPFVAIGKLYPQHKSIPMFLDWALPRIEEATKKPPEKRFLSTEGCYTYAYPLMQVAINRKDPKLAQTAIDEILVRMHRLVDSAGGISQRAAVGKKPTLRNWGRGCAWYMLGLVQTMRAMDNSPLKNADLKGVAEIKKAIADSAKYLAQFQQANGSWYCFIDDSKTGDESSSSVGIGASFALAAEAGYVDESYIERADKVLDWFFAQQQNIEPDGYSKNVTQSNRIGDLFQRSGYRVIMQISSGLAAQIIAVQRRALKREKK